MKITVVAPVRNEEDSIDLLLQGLLKQTLSPDEIVIVDGGSTDNTTGIVEQRMQECAHLRLIREPNALPGRGRNVGAAQAANDWLAFIDAGVSPATEWLAELADCARTNPKAEVVYGTWEPVIDSFFTECAAIAYGYVPTSEVDHKFIQSRAVFSSLVHRSVWLAVDGFPEDLRSAEDLLFMNRIDEAGFEVAYTPRAVVRWQMQPTWWRTFRRFTTYSRHNMRAALSKEWQVSILARYAALLVCMALLIGLTRWWASIAVALTLLMFAARAIVTLWRNRKRYPAGAGRNLWRMFVLIPLLATIDAASILGVVAWLVMDKLNPGRPSRASERI